jgi:predicted transcriptional regulator of viral defense system
MSYIAAVVRFSTISRLGKIAEEQWGLLTRQHAVQVAGIAPATFARLASDGSILERVAHGVYHLAGAPLPDHLDLRAAWLQLAPETPAWDRRPDQGVVSHRSAAALYGIGHLPADRHDFTLPKRRQSRRADVRLHERQLEDREWIDLRGLPVTRPSRIASDLLYGREDPEAVAHLAADAIRSAYDYSGRFADALASHAVRFGLRQSDGLGLLRWLLDLVGDPDTSQWLREARAHEGHELGERADPEDVAQ